MIGTVLGQYRLVEKIGEGGMGVVYLADDLRLEPRFVLALARALEETDPAAARAEYERFLLLWARADAAAPELAEARRKVAARIARD